MSQTKSGYLLISGAVGTDGTRTDVLIGPGEEGERAVLRAGRIANAGLPPKTAVFRADGLLLLPAFTDLSAFPDRQKTVRALSDEMLSAACGGFGHVVIADPAADVPSFLSRTARAADACGGRAAVTALLSPSSDPMALYGAGARIFVTDMKASVRTLLRLIRTMPEDCVFLCPCRDPEGDGGLSDDPFSRRIGRGSPEITEELAAEKYVLLSRETGRHLHLTGLTTEGALLRVAAAKDAELPVTCDVPAYAAAFSSADLIYYGANALLSPPLRSEQSRSAVRRALADGTADAVTSCHYPCTKSEKASVKNAVPGAVGFQTVFGTVMTELVQTGLVSVKRAADLLSAGPARILGREAEIRVGAPADLVLADPYREWVVTADVLRGRSSATPYLGGTLTGTVVRTVLDGELI